MKGGKILSGIAVIWLVSGGVAAYQRDYFSDSEVTCATVASVAMTVIVGPLNYRGVNAEATDCALPEPSQ
ncbi:hypothetical protein A5722_16805 [Mycobacterium vulneris]|uniref:hypothetical protein n=1 Tax=Mycolicibacterium porcinum TaxID=39693 RepID=UPI00080AF910|nr:hypothetical protein [Mycolicibacterium porcinum]MBX8687612.1 hypothetical protein [Mycobacterium sp. 20091114027_K0903767]OCB41793.1 hypothetical protein A5721_30180 [Mycolicibacterium vulneris]OCB10100.1 hypothetical protein A5717_23825 [Mycolicibacterium porcinum]OCB55612.1 hypothetical protein A5722_16805 [Mycolicibacterium vulneris]OCB65545.1 hypothetical protein A5729_15640 [Mycolicibacterium vulneris]